MTTAGDVGSGTGAEPMVKYGDKILKRKIKKFSDYVKVTEFNPDDMTDKIIIAKEVKKRYKLDKFPIYMDDFKADSNFNMKIPNGKIKVYVNTTSFSSPVYEFEWL